MNEVSSRYLTGDGRVLLWDGTRVLELARGVVTELFSTTDETIQIDSADGVDVFATRGLLRIRRHGGAFKDLATAGQTWAVLATSHLYWEDAGKVWRAPIDDLGDRESLEGCTLRCGYSIDHIDPRGEGKVGLICGEHPLICRGAEIMRTFWRKPFCRSMKLGRELVVGSSNISCWGGPDVDAGRLDDGRNARFNEGTEFCEIGGASVTLQSSSRYLMWRYDSSGKVSFASHSAKWCDD